MASTPTTLQLGHLTLHGTISPDGLVASFLGVPFAHIPARWRQAALLDAFDARHAGTLDATRYGPIVPQPPSAATAGQDGLRQEEFGCLNLNVWVPVKALEEGGMGEKEGEGEEEGGLPVVAWVHGGGYMWGHNAAQDGSHLVRRALAPNKPLIVVALNYRMHLLGLVGCRELREEALAHGEHGYFNLGLHDQRLGFQWIARHIHAFGGTAGNVTAMGESAGAHSLLWHLKGGVPVFRRAIVHSAPFHQPVTMADHQAQWDALFAKLGVAGAPTAVKLSAARSLSVDEVVAAYDASTPAFPCVDDGFLLDYSPATIGEGAYWGTWPRWIDSVVLCAMKEEGSFCLPEYVSASPATMRAALLAATPDAAFAATIADAYGITDDASDQPAAFYALQKFVGDGFFVCHAADTAREAARRGRRVFFAGFDARDEDQPRLPWLKPGCWAYHAFDVPFLFYAPSTTSRESYKRVADELSARYAAFAHGAAPWEGLGVKGRCGVFGGEGGFGMEELAERVQEGDQVRTSVERRRVFREGAYKLHLNIFEAGQRARRKE